MAILVGQEGIGKSTVVIDIAARATRGILPGDLLGTPVSVVYATAEDSPERTIKPRFAAAGADLERVLFVTIDGIQGGLVVPTHLDDLKLKMAHFGAHLLVLDPFGAHLADRIDTHKDSAVRQALAPLSQYMDGLDAVALGIMHWNKSTATVALDRLNGSRGFSAAARTVLGFGEDPTDPSTKLVLPVKANLGRVDLPALGYRIESREVDLDGCKLATSAVCWIGEVQGVTSADLLSHPDEEQRAERSDAEDFLRAYLSEGPRRGAEVIEAAKGQGLAERTVQRAKARVGVLVRRTGFGSESATWWSLGEQARKPLLPVLPTSEAGTMDDDGTKG